MAGVSFQDFQTYLDALGVDLEGEKALAVAVSGGPDSMALAFCLRRWAEGLNQAPVLHFLTVDHGLRSESAEEAENVQAVCGTLLGDLGRHHILRWEGEKPQASLQEAARRARYDLMAGYCAVQGIRCLFLAHHMDDQAETLLFRLAKGSGLDGLSGMRPVQAYGDDLMSLRPFLRVGKDELVQTCVGNGVDYVRDPSNENERFARVRLRRSREVLEEEGLSAKRLAVTARRLERARDALDVLSRSVFENNTIELKTNRIVFNFNGLIGQPEEIVLRCLLMGFAHLRPDADYMPRFEKIEAMLGDLLRCEGFRKRTLDGGICELESKAGHLILRHEK